MCMFLSHFHLLPHTRAGTQASPIHMLARVSYCPPGWAMEDRQRDMLRWRLVNPESDVGRAFSQPLPTPLPL